jgi:hypothetical protein
MMNADQKWQDARRKVLAVGQGAARRLFASPDGQAVISMLSKTFEGEMVSVDKNGKVDENAVLLNVGAAQVINFLRDLAEPEGDRE